jgi:hypothetical protein
MAEDKLNARIISALETAPRTEIPSGFAARVAGHAPVLPAVSTGRYGDRAAVACLLGLIGLMLACAFKMTGHSVFWTSLEWIFCVQFGLLAVWLVARNAGYTFASFF